MSPAGLMEVLAFLAVAAAAFLSAILVVFHRNLVVNAVALVVNLACIALFFLLLRAPFLAAVQVIAYAGAIMVLFLFVIMLLDLGSGSRRPRRVTFQRWMAAVGGVGLLGLLLKALRWSQETFTFENPGGREFGTTEQVAERLFTQHLIPFELAAVLLLVAMVGALVLARGFLGPAGRKG